MRLTLVTFAAVVAGCATNPTADTTQPADRACAVDDCFYERDVRDFEVINQTTLIVYVGNQRCAFEVELHGAFCDLSFAPELYFFSPSELSPDTERDVITGGSASSRLGDLRICRNDINVSVSGGVFTSSPGTTSGTRRAECQISSVQALTDDELVELYVSKGAPPPPPIGSGEIKVGEQEEQGTGTAPPSGESQPAPASGVGEQPAAKAF